jgi:hypothetical protein
MYVCMYQTIFTIEELNTRTASAIVEVKHRSQSSVIGDGQPNYLLSRTSDGTRTVGLASYTPTNPHWAHVLGYGEFSICNLKEGQCQGDINRPKMMLTITRCFVVRRRTCAEATSDRCTS